VEKGKILNGMGVFFISLTWGLDKAKAEFEIRQGLILEDKFNHINVRFGKKPDHVDMLWEKAQGTAFNYIMVYDNRICIMLNTDNENVVDKAIKEINTHYLKKLSKEELLALQAEEDRRKELNDNSK